MDMERLKKAVAAAALLPPSSPSRACYTLSIIYVGKQPQNIFFTCVVDEDQPTVALYSRPCNPFGLISN